MRTMLSCMCSNYIRNFRLHPKGSRTTAYTRRSRLSIRPKSLLKAICPPDYEQKQFWKNNIHNIIVYDKTLAVKGCMEPPKKRIYEDLEVLHFRHNSTSTFTAARFSNHNSAVIRAYISNKWDYIFTLNDSHQPLNVYLYFAVKNGIVYVIDLFRDTFGTYTYEEYLARYGFDDIWIYAILLAP